jgi:hypothetical protein
VAVVLVLIVCAGAFSGCSSLGEPVFANENPKPKPPDNRSAGEVAGDTALAVLGGLLYGIGQSGFHYSFSP